MPTHKNPADIASRGCHPSALKVSIWFTGPDFLENVDLPDFCAVLPSLVGDPEIKVSAMTIVIPLEKPSMLERLVL